MKKFLSIFVAIIIAIPMFLLVGCFGDDHTHNFAATWSYDATHHWYACKGEGCEETKDKAEHTFDADTCTVCGYEKDVPVVSTTYNFSKPTTDNLAGTLKQLYSAFDEDLAPGNDMEVEINSDNTFVLTLYNDSYLEYIKYETVVSGTFNNNGTFEIESAIEKKFVFDKNVYSREVEPHILKQEMSSIRFGFVNDNNYFVLQSIGYNYVFVKEGYTPVVGETIVANFPLRAGQFIQSDFTDCTGIPNTFGLMTLNPYMTATGSYIFVNEEGKLAHAPVVESELVSFDGLEFVEDATLSDEDNAFVAKEYKNLNLRLDLNETKTESKDDDTLIPFVSFNVINASAECNFYSDTSLSYPSYVDVLDTAETFLDRETFYYTVRGGVTKYTITPEMLEINLNYDAGNFAKLTFTLPDPENPSKTFLNEFVVPIIDISKVSCDIYIYPIVDDSSNIMYVEKGTNIETALSACSFDFIYADGDFEFGDYEDLVVSGKLTHTEINTSNAGTQVLTFTYLDKNGNNSVLDVLVFVVDPEDDPVVYQYYPIVITLDADDPELATPALTAEYFNNLEISVSGYSICGEEVYDVIVIDFNDLMGITEFTAEYVENNIEEMISNEYEAKLRVDMTNNPYTNFTYNQTVSISFLVLGGD